MSEVFKATAQKQTNASNISNKTEVFKATKHKQGHNNSAVAAQKLQQLGLVPDYKKGIAGVKDQQSRLKGFDSYAEEQRYKQNNPNLYEAMGGTKYNPIPSKNPTWLTDEGKQTVDEAQKADSQLTAEQRKQGWEKYLADEKSKVEAKEKEENDKGFWAKLAEYLGKAQDSTIPGAEISRNIQALREDESYKKPTNKWNEAQKQIFGGLYLSSPEKAYEYAIQINNSINQKAKNKELEEIEKSATSNVLSGAAHTAGAILTSPLGLADYIQDLTENAARGTITTDSSVTPFEYSQKVTGSITSKLNEKGGTLNENIPVIGGKGWGDIYSLGTSIAQSAIAGYTSGGVGTAVSFFGSAAAAGIDDALSRGATEETAILYGTFLGVAEAAAEQFGIENLFKIGSSATLKEFFINLLKQAGAEGLEEGTTSVLNNFADNILMQDKSNFYSNVKYYMTEKNMSEKEAKKKAWTDSIEDIAFDVLGGFASGALHAAPHTAIQTYANKKITAQQQTELEASTNAISQPVASYPKEKQGIIQSFLTSVDEKVKSLVEKVKGGSTEFERLTISEVSEREAADIKNLLGIDVSGYTHNINTSGVKHILNRHGENGAHDTTMSSSDDIARVGWVMENYDTVEVLEENGEKVYSKELRDKNDNPAPQIRYSKKINGTYYVVEAAAENKHNKLWVQSVYIQKNNEAVTQAPDASNTTPETTAKTALASPASNISISQNRQNVNTNSATNINNGLQKGNNGGIINNNDINGVENDGSTDTELLERGAVSTADRGGNSIRQQGGNSEALLNRLERFSGRQRKSSQSVQAGNSGWLVRRGQEKEIRSRFKEGLHRKLSGIKLKDIDSAGRKIESAVQKRFSNTVLKNEDGTIISVFHWTQNEFDEFAYGDIGFHGGTLQSTFDRQDDNSELGKNHFFKEMYFNITNPLYFESDGGIWDAEAVAARAKDIGVITADEMEYLRTLEGFRYGKYSDKASVEIRRILKEKGYDGIIYVNEHEDKGSLSVIAFDADQILTVAENGVLKEGCGVTEDGFVNSKSFSNNEQHPNSDTDYELSDNDQYAKDKSFWTAENKNDTTVSKSLKDKLAGLFGKGSEKKTVSIAEIVKQIEKEFNVPVSKGKFREKAYGIYKNHSQAIRTKISNALPTIAHELGHHIDNKYGLRYFESIGEAERIFKETRPDFYNSYKPEARPREAVAEFMRDYLADRKMAKGKYPFFFEEFERRLSESGKTDLENLKAVGDKINEYYTAELRERAKAAIISRKEAKKLKRMEVKLNDVLTRAETEILDDGAAFKEISDEAYDLYYWAKKSSVRAKNTLTGYYMSGFNEDVVKQRDKDGNIIKDENGNELYVPALKFILSEIESGTMFDDFNDYLVCRHGVEWLKQDLRVYADDALNTKSYMTGNVEYLEKQYPHFKETAENLYEWYRTFVYEYGVKSGLMTKEQYKALVEKYPCYVPFMRNIEGKKKGFAKSGVANQNAPIKKAKGSGLEIYTPIESLAIKVEQFMKAADRNAVMQKIADTVDSEGGFGWLLEEVPPDMVPNTISSQVIKNTAKRNLKNEGLDESAADEFSNLIDELIGESITDFKIGTFQGENVVAVRRNGKRTFYQIHDKNMLAAVTGLNPKQFDVVTKAFGKLTRVFKALTTGSNAVWSIVSNAPRDFDSAYKYGSENNPIKYTVDYIKAVASQFGTKDTEIMKLYRTLGGGYNNSFANAGELQLTLRELLPKDKNFAERVKSWFNIVNDIAKLADFVETAPRLAEFKRVYERTGDAKKAMLAAEEVTVNFNRSGKLTKTLDQYIPYLNASLQANAKYAKTIAQSFSKDGDKSFLVKSIVTAIIKTGLTFGILGLYGDEGEEEYEKLSAYKKNNFYNIYLGGGKFLSIPKSQATGVFDSLLERVFEISRKEDVEWGQEIKDFAGYMWLTFGPPLVDDTIIVNTVVDLAKNEDFTGAPIVPSYYEDLVPEKQYNEKTTYIAKAIGQLFGWSPMKIDHIIESNLGIFGLINKSLGRAEKDWTLGTKTKVVTDSAYSTDILNNFYDKADDYASKAKSYPDNAEYVYKDKQYTAIKSIVSALNGYGKDDPELAREYKILARDYVDRFEKDTEVNQKLLNLLEKTGNDDILYDRTFKPTYSINKVEYKMTSEEFMELVDTYYKEVEKEYADIFEMNLSEDTTARMLTKAKENTYNKVAKNYKKKR